MTDAQINKAKQALERMDIEIKVMTGRLSKLTQKTKRCKKSMEEHLSKLKKAAKEINNMKDSLIKNKLSANMMVKDEFIRDLDDFTEYINGVFNAFIRNAEGIVKDLE